MKGRMRFLLLTGGVLVIVAAGAAFTKRKAEDDAYYNRHLRAAHTNLDERLALAKELDLPLEAAAFEKSWGDGPDMWPELAEIRRKLSEKNIWPAAVNYPLSSFKYSDATLAVPDLEDRIVALGLFSTCKSIPDIDKGAMSPTASTANARGVTRILVAKADEEISRGHWMQAQKTLMLADHIARVAAKGPNREGLLTWCGNQLTLHRKMIMTMGQGKLEPERIALYRAILTRESSAPDIIPAINFEYFTRYWASAHYNTLTPQEIADIVVFSPSEETPPPKHPASSDAMRSSVLGAWTTAIKDAKAHPKNPRQAGIMADYPYITTILRLREEKNEHDTGSDYMLVTMDTVFEQTGGMISRTLETRAMALAVMEHLLAEKAGKPFPALDKLTPPQGDYDGRKLLRAKTKDGWVIYLEDTKKPADQPYGLTDRVTEGILTFRWKSG